MSITRTKIFHIPGLVFLWTCMHICMNQVISGIFTPILKHETNLLMHNDVLAMVIINWTQLCNFGSQHFHTNITIVSYITVQRQMPELRECIMVYGNVLAYELQLRNLRVSLRICIMQIICASYSTCSC